MKKLTKKRNLTNQTIEAYCNCTGLAVCNCSGGSAFQSLNDSTWSAMHMTHIFV